MGSELVSACVFCAGLLFGMEAEGWPGVSAEIAVAYATAARSLDIAPDSRDLSDVTPKFVLVGAGGARPTAQGLGAGTPAAEWRIRVALAPSHDEQEQTPYSTQNTIATGTGRYENYALLLRVPFTSHDSLEAGGERRTHKGTDLVHLGGQRFILGEERTLSAERIDLGLGWRHRWPGFEAAASFRAVRPSGSTGTAGAFLLTRGPLYGAGLELRARRGRWTVWAGGERASGSLDVHEESAPDFFARNFSENASLEAYRAGVLYSWGRREALLSGTWNRERLPFVALTPLGTETVAFESGFHPESRSSQFFGELTVRHAIARAVHVRAFLRLGYGDETVVLTDSAGEKPDRRLDVRRSGVFGAGLSRALGSPQVTVGVGADFKLDTGQ